MSFIETAFAMGPQAGGGTGGDDLFTSLIIPCALIFLVFYFLLIRPQKKKSDEHKRMLSELKKGDPIMTVGGIYGRIVDVDGDLMTIDLGETRVVMSRGYLQPAPQQKQAAPPLKREKKNKKDAGKDAAPASGEKPETPGAETGAAPAPGKTPADSGNDPDKPAQ